MVVPPNKKQPILRGMENYKEWKQWIEFTARSQGILKHITGEMTAPLAPTSTEIAVIKQHEINSEDWDMKEGKAQLLIFMNCTRQVRGHLGLLTSAQMWEKLKLFEQSNFTHLFECWTSFSTLRLDWCENLEQYCSKFNRCISDISQLDIMLPDQIVVIQFFSGLDHNYEAWISRKRSEITSSSKIPSLQSLIFEVMTQTPIEDKSGYSGGLVNNHSKFNNVKRCENCHKTGHDANDCWRGLTCSYCGRRGHPVEKCHQKIKDDNEPNSASTSPLPVRRRAPAHYYRGCGRTDASVY